MFEFMSLGLWLFLGIVICIQVYAFYAENIAHLPSGKPIVGVACQTHDSLIRRLGNRSAPARVVFASNRNNSPAIKELSEIANDIAMLHGASDEDGEFELATVNEFVNTLQRGQFADHVRIQVPEPLARGYELYVAEVMLHSVYLHPSFAQHRVVVLAKTGTKKGKAFLLPWNNSAAQKLFAGQTAG